MTHTATWDETEVHATPDEMERVARAIAANLPEVPKWDDFLIAAHEAIAALRYGHYAPSDG